MVFQWFLILLPSLSMVFDGSGPLVKRCDGFDGSLWSIRGQTDRWDTQPQNHRLGFHWWQQRGWDSFCQRTQNDMRKVQTWADMRKVHQQCSLLSLRTTSLSQHEIREHVKQVWLNVVALFLCVCVCVHVSPFSSIFIHFCPDIWNLMHKLTNIDLCCQ